MKKNGGQSQTFEYCACTNRGSIFEASQKSVYTNPRNDSRPNQPTLFAQKKQKQKARERKNCFSRLIRVFKESKMQNMFVFRGVASDLDGAIAPRKSWLNYPNNNFSLLNIFILKLYPRKWGGGHWAKKRYKKLYPTNFLLHGKYFFFLFHLFLVLLFLEKLTFYFCLLFRQN